MPTGIGDLWRGGVRGARAVWRWVRRPRNLVGVGVLVVVFGTAPSVWAYAAVAGRTGTIADVPARQVAIVFGAGLTGAGDPTPFLATRLDIAADLFRRAKVRAVLVTGDTWDSCVRARKIFDVSGATLISQSALITAVTRPDPRFLGRREDGVTRALAP